jgi:hypothetical protein
VARLAPLGRDSTEPDGAGIAALDGQRCAAVIEAAPVCLQLADPHEAQTALDAIGQILSAQTGPFSISTLTERISLEPYAAQAAAIAEQLATPELAEFAARQAAHLREIAEERDLWHRRVLLTLHDTGTGAPARLAHRAQATADLLGACAMPARVLDGAELTALAAAACDPRRTPAPRRLTPPDATVTAAPATTEALGTTGEEA